MMLARLAVVLCVAGLACLVASANAQETQDTGKTIVIGNPGSQATLPPELPWDGRSRRLAREASDPWATLCEQSGFKETPGYHETVGWLRRLVDSSSDLEMISLGKSARGRDIWMVVASREQAFTPEAMGDSDRPVLLAQAGIHAGEIDGKDAGMMFLRDLRSGESLGGLLDQASFLFIPILNVDGHERFSPYNRINQRGPRETGWRTNARNLNLNRDYTKVETPELRALIAALRAWDPDLYVDVHVTDGLDYQYDITWGYNGPQAHSPNAAAWLDAYFTPGVTGDLRAIGHIPGPLIFEENPMDPSEGIRQETFTAKYSTGYGDARHTPSVLLEAHSLKPYAQRVLGTYQFFDSAMRILGDHGKELKGSIKADRKQRRKIVPLGWVEEPGDPGTVSFLGVKWRTLPSAISGGLRVEWTGQPEEFRIPQVSVTHADPTASRPKAYWIPPEWSDIAERLELHGIEVDRTSEAEDVRVTMYRLVEPVVDPVPYEGHVRVTATTSPEKRMEHFPEGSFRVSTDQPLGTLAMLLLEPGSADSFFWWGYFLEILQNPESAEGYVMEPLASRMLAETPGLGGRFTDRMAEDPEFAADGAARLQWFYEKTAFFDTRWRLYPIGREEQ